MSPGGLDSAGTAGSDETGASVGLERPEPELGTGLEGAGAPIVEADEQAASSALPISIAAASVVKRGIVQLLSSSMVLCVRRRG